MLATSPVLKRTIIRFSIAALASLVGVLAPPPAHADPTDDEAAQFVRHVYDAGRIPISNVLFNQPLYGLLVQEALNHAAARGETCGFLDFNGFTDSQEKVGRTVGARVTKSGDARLVELRFDKATDYGVIVKVVMTAGKWRIVNVLYPARRNKPGGDLMTAMHTVLNEKCAKPLAPKGKRGSVTPH